MTETELEPGAPEPLGLWSLIRDRIAAARRSSVSRGVAASYVNAAAGVLSTLILVPMYLRYLGSEEYGLWITVSGVVAYLGLVNLGITQTTANRFGEAIAHGEDGKAELVLNAGLWTYAKIVLIALVVSTVAGQMLPWAWLVRGDAHLALMARKLISVAAAVFLFELPFTIFGACLRNIGRIYVQQTVVIGQTIARCVAAIVYLLMGGHVVGVIVLLASINIATHLVLLAVALRP
jgi:O-antigen/teichoic acid export membrane protein